MSNQATKISRKIRQGTIEIDAEESALVVNFTLEVVNMEENGRVLEVLDSKPDTRRIKIKTISPDRNLADMAHEIIEKCKYIHPSRVEEVEQLLIQLNRINNEKEKAANNENNKKKEKKEKKKEIITNNDENNLQKRKEPIDDGPPANMENIDDYLELLYQVSSKNDNDNDEGLKAQLKGTSMILKLCRVVVNLEILIQNNTVMGALTRVFQEEYKKSSELTFNILRIFLAFSNFMEMHPLMATYSIGILTMKAIEFEFKRCEHRANERSQLVINQMEEINQLKQKYQQQQQLDLPSSSSSTPSTGGGSGGGGGGGTATATPSALDVEINKLTEKHRQILDKHDNKTIKLNKKSSKILFISFYILLNLSEDCNIERKMIKRGLLDYLLNIFQYNYNTEDLLLLVLTFIKKLIIYDENKNYFKENNIINKLLKYLPCSSQSLIAITLRVLYNLSFDHHIREQCIQLGYIPKLINLLKIPLYRGISLRLLYHFTIEDRCKSMFTYITDGIPLLIGMIINFPQNYLTKELAGVVINISLNMKNAEIIASNRGLNHLIDRVLTTRDPLLMKIIRNLSLWSFNTQQQLDNPELQYKYRGLWSPHIKNLCKLALECDSSASSAPSSSSSPTSHDLLIEILGTFANLTSLDLPINQNYSKILIDYNLLNLLNKLLIPGMAQNDVILEIIMIFSSALSDQQCIKIIFKYNLLTIFYQLWKDKSNNDIEILLQLMFLYEKLFLLNHPEIQDELLINYKGLIMDIIELLTHSNSAIRALADNIVEIILEIDRHEITGELGQLGIQIRKKRFESYNSKWLLEMNYEDELTMKTISNGGGGGGGSKGNNRMGGGGYVVNGYEDEDEEDMGRGHGQGQGHDYIQRHYVNDDEHEEDMAWRALRLAQQQDPNSLDYTGGGVGGMSPGTISSDGEDGHGDDVWSGRRQYK